MQYIEGCAGVAGTEPHAWETGPMDTITYVGMDVHKATVSVALAEAGRGGEIRQFGFREPPRDSEEAGGAVEQRKASPELLLRGRSVRLWAASAINRLRA